MDISLNIICVSILFYAAVDIIVSSWLYTGIRVYYNYTCITYYAEAIIMFTMYGKECMYVYKQIVSIHSIL